MSPLMLIAKGLKDIKTCVFWINGDAERVSAVNKSENQDVILGLCFQNSHQKVRSPELNLKK